MVKHIVGAHGGEVDVESELGKGATFKIVLPAVEKG
jgi:signal transduction histidine kinase